MSAPHRDQAGAVTDINGYYEISDLYPGTYNLHAQYGDYDLSPPIEDINVGSGSTTTVDFLILTTPPP